MLGNQICKSIERHAIAAVDARQRQHFYFGISMSHLGGGGADMHHGAVSDKRYP